eukprot:CAMPEP_0206124492 /NCGR_PEP_ID=MMETSP1472-20131121/12614_1 /ASSEMBLY_ACC=CAM_ASM_001108 /TAXON_ID=41880 /ORGANISM="Pycnococcus provasolii, Strain RCC251" /LENGTH=36 /DNA_ID= /DNA_START= /DNA_END= /DNA_ORIENTATION=
MRSFFSTKGKEQQADMGATPSDGVTGEQEPSQSPPP